MDKPTPAMSLVIMKSGAVVPQKTRMGLALIPTWNLEGPSTADPAAQHPRSHPGSNKYLGRVCSSLRVEVESGGMYNLLLRK
jgi:hypothetical protein